MDRLGGLVQQSPRTVDFLGAVDKVAVVHDAGKVGLVRVAVEDASCNVAAVGGDQLLDLAVHAPVVGLAASLDNVGKVESILCALKARSRHKSLHDKSKDVGVNSHGPAFDRTLKAHQKTPEPILKQQMNRAVESTTADDESLKRPTTY